MVTGALLQMVQKHVSPTLLCTFSASEDFYFALYKCAHYYYYYYYYYRLLMLLSTFSIKYRRKL